MSPNSNAGGSESAGLRLSRPGEGIAGYTGRPTQAGTGSLPRQQPRRSLAAWGGGPGAPSARAPLSGTGTGRFPRAAESPDGCRGQEPTGAYHRHPPNVAPSSSPDVGHCAVAATECGALAWRGGHHDHDHESLCELRLVARPTAVAHTGGYLPARPTVAHTGGYRNLLASVPLAVSRTPTE